jgi:pyruvate/2-oxoacid:ferredoxin oxidoreductase beta subunit
LRSLISQSGCFAIKLTCILAGDEWACDLGYEGLRHISASGENVNVLGLTVWAGCQGAKFTQTRAVSHFSVERHE